jgi:hypothetical protein
MRALGRLALVSGAACERVAHADLLQHQDFVLDVDLALGFGAELAIAGVDPARFQRATEGAAKSTGGGGDDIVERGCVLRLLTGSGPLVLAHRPVRPERDVRVDREVRLSDRSAFSHDPDLRHVDRLSPHGDEATAG